MPPEASYTEWVRRAQGNLALARMVSTGVVLEDLCFEAQQAAEKAIKALLIFHGRDFPYTHDLATLITVVVDVGISVPQGVGRAPILTRYALFTRYPGSEPPVTADEYEDALLVAETVLDWAVTMIAATGGAAAL